MNDVSKQQLSALMDGELAADETRFLMRRMRSDPAMALTWSRYHILRECLQGQALAHVHTEHLCQSIAQHTHASTRPAASRSSRWLRVGMGGALAASVAVAALVMVRPAPDVAPDSVLTAQSHHVAPQIASIAAAAPSAVATHPADQDFSLLLHGAGSPLLNVEPASATRSEGFYAPNSSFARHAPPQWIVVPQPRASNNVLRFAQPHAAIRQQPQLLRQSGSQ
ncbi:MAG: sigma-E factor negative regulatory protein [Xanthomonadales bacterium]|nr:sigma-E factor negative regulatory protein [Xanthomonadales bacterium]